MADGAAAAGSAAAGEATPNIYQDADGQWWADITDRNTGAKIGRTRLNESDIKYDEDGNPTVDMDGDDGFFGELGEHFANDVHALERLGGDLSGKTAAEERQAALETWAGLEDHMPSRDDLVGGDFYKMGPALQGEAQADAAYVDAQRAALQRLQGLSRGGITDADRAAQQQGLRGAAMQEGALRDQMMAQQQASGMGQSGAAFSGLMDVRGRGARLGADATMGVEGQAQQRALAAMQQYGSAASTARGQSFGEDYRRRSAIDEWNARNTQRRNEYRRDRGTAAQQEYQNRERQIAGATNQYNESARKSDESGRAKATGLISAFL